MKTMKSLMTLMFVALLVLVLGACGNNDKDDASDNKDTSTSESASDTQYPIEIKHALGTTTIEKKPERVATIAWANHDVALALGVVPVGFSAANYGIKDIKTGILPWTQEKLDELGEKNPNVYQDTDGLDFEAIADSQPDVILAAYSGLTQEEYDKLREIAPVVAYQDQPWVTSWRDQIKYDSMAMGMEKEGQALIEKTEKTIADTAAKYPELKGKKAAFGMFNTTDLSKFYIYTPADPRGEMLEELGMEYPQGIKDQLKDDSSFYLELSAENADALNDTELFVVYGDDKTLKALQKDPILGKVPAIKAGNVVVIEDNTPLAAAGTPSPLSIEYTIDDYTSKIAEVAKNVK
ncbi:iron-siderophore ABC transporter substrate-binding protein [Kurthia massiliensis]|uniref:iron-siderophore ABC transporter substrate-binding protein n=1 Tax=Kurthia massiliensis TaxID=1033739 RepID=UPI000288EA15|nr:iron-siderophore ABC transporter substrate-binding protein [Kurthia massiliensis]